MRRPISTFGFGVVDLKLRLALRVVALAAICFFLAAICMLIADDRFQRSQMEAIAEVVGKGLELQLEQFSWVRLENTRFPDLELVASPFLLPGLCIEYRAAADATSQRFFCSGTRSAHAPKVFATLYRWFRRDSEVVRPITFGKRVRGFAVVSVDTTSLIEQSWNDMGRLLAVIAVTLTALCGLIYVAVERLLRPTRIIVSGLEALSASDFSTRLPKFDLAELSSIRTVFNSLAETLERTVAERNALTQRLIAVQDEERLVLSRELHDEFAQSLTAIGAMAASVAHTAKSELPALLPECRGISRATAQMMDTLRGALVRLRPPDIAELGLTASLQSLVADWNSRTRGTPIYEINVAGSIDDLPIAFGTNLYRIVQEAVTNAAKHANAQHVVVRVQSHDRTAADGGPKRSEVELLVEDDGIGFASSAKSGMGLVGMRERVAALDGRMSFETRDSKGTRLRAVVPLPSAKREAVA
ncbi:ATP-binding protein [Methylobacterium gnaphalii]|nr:ATP-binding protein [Methylobacterium gnaphalii]GJD71777.1 hypothetical protein MMMDOFMJ_4742 [Methylobacterium gnaphalii]